jgi:membrane protease YdiL (CAAX protease family)
VTRDSDERTGGSDDGSARSATDEFPEGTATSPEAPASPPGDGDAVGSGWNDEGARTAGEPGRPTLGDPLDFRAVARAVLASLSVALLGLGGGLVVVYAAVFGVGAAGVEITPLLFLVISLVLVQGFAFGGTALAYLRYRGRVRGFVGVGVPDVRDGVVTVMGYVLALGGGIGGAVLVAALGVEAGTNQAAELATRDPSVLLLLVPASFLFIGPGEELLFRGIVQGRLRETLPAPFAVGLASLLFAAVHYVALSGSAGARLVSVGVLLGPALVFGAAYELTDNIVVPSLIHGAYNATLFTLLYAALRFESAGAGTGALVW